MNHVLTIDFTKFIASEIIVRENSDGDEVEGIFIPFELNEIKRGKGGARFAYYYVIEKLNDYYFNQTHYVTPKFTEDHRSFLNFLGYKKAYIGNLTPCFDKKMNKLSQKYMAMAKKGYVKVNKEEEVDE